MAGKLTLIFEPDQFGAESIRMCVGLDDHTVLQIERVPPPPPPELGLVSFNDVVEIIRAREYRKDWFINQCKRLGALIAERMEDAEGWHDVSRVEPAKQQLKTGKPVQ